MKERVIVLRNGKYLIDEITEENTPLDIVLKYPSKSSSRSVILKNLVDSGIFEIKNLLIRELHLKIFIRLRNGVI